MALACSWFLIAFAALHLVVGCRRFKVCLQDALRQGFINQFTLIEERKTAFWFMASGWLVLLIGCLGLRAGQYNDPGFFAILGAFLLCLALRHSKLGGAMGIYV